MTWFTQTQDKITITVSVVPRSSRSEIVGIFNDSVKIKLTSSPHDNEANEELIRLLSKNLKIPKSNIKIIKGQTQKKKIINVFGCNKESLVTQVYRNAQSKTTH